MEENAKKTEEFEEVKDLDYFLKNEKAEGEEKPAEDNKKSRKAGKKPMKPEKIAIIAGIAALAVAVGIFLGVKLIHKCDNCGKIFAGTGYVGTGLNQLVKEDYVCCKDCAEKKHAWEISLFGGSHSLDEFKKPFFGSSDKELKDPTIQNEK